MFNPTMRKRCIELFGIDPEDSYKGLLLELAVSGNSFQRLIHALERAKDNRRGAKSFGPIAWTEYTMPLSPGEVRVMALASLGLGNPEIAQTLFVGLETVKSQMKSVLMKLEAKSRTEAVVKFLLLVSQDDELMARIEGSPS